MTTFGTFAGRFVRWEPDPTDSAVACSAWRSDAGTVLPTRRRKVEPASETPSTAELHMPPANEEIGPMTDIAAAPTKELAAVASLLRKLDIGMLTTRAADGALHGRPMSNNGPGSSLAPTAARSPRSTPIRGSSSPSSTRRTAPGSTSKARRPSSVTVSSVSATCGSRSSSAGSRTARMTRRSCSSRSPRAISTPGPGTRICPSTSSAGTRVARRRGSRVR